MPHVNNAPVSIKAAKPAKPEKPYADFPLTAHPSGRWCKKVRGKVLFFGPWRDPQGSLTKWLAEKDYLLAGRVPPPNAAAGGLTVADLCNRFLTAKLDLKVTGELTARSFADYNHTTDRIVALLGKTRLVDNLTTEDFEKMRASLGKTLGPVSIGNEVQRIRCVFRYGFEAGLMEKSVRFGPMFKRPSRKVLRRLRGDRGEKIVEAVDLRKIIEAADGQLKAMVLLAINCGFGNTDCGRLPMKAIDLDGGWIRFPRPKTGVDRRCPLWPETVEALRAAVADRPKPKDADHAGLAFITKYGGPWAKETSDSPISKEWRKLVGALGLHQSRIGFYSLRHTFQTIGDEARDPVAVANLMGHVDASMAGHYRQRISDERLRAVVGHVRAWLFSEVVNAEGKAAEAAQKKTDAAAKRKAMTKGKGKVKAK